MFRTAPFAHHPSVEMPGTLTDCALISNPCLLFFFFFFEGVLLLLPLGFSQTEIVSLLQ